MIRLGAPVRGWAMPLEEVPDPVFAERMMGDGIAIDPLDNLIVAPADATVAAIAPTAHAVTLRLANGAHLLIHIGLDTVQLGGEGFEACVAVGDPVFAGTPLIRFDLEGVARRAKSLITPIVLIDAGFSLAIEALDRLVAPGEIMMIVEGRLPAQTRQERREASVERRIVVLLPNGLHARPAARIVNRLKSASAQVTIAANGRSADARSMVALLALGLEQGSEPRLSAAGPDAELAVAAVAALLQGAGEADEFAAAAPAPPVPASAGPLFRGLCASPGIAIGPVAQYRPAAIRVACDGAGTETEAHALDAAIAAVGAALRRDGDRGNGVADAHLAILEDPELIGEARAEIAAGRSAGHAWRTAGATAAMAIRTTGNFLLIERIADLEDVERQVLAHLGGAAPDLPEVPQGAILIAEDLLPSQFLALRSTAAGIVTAAGGTTSHVAILAASAGIPMLVAAGPAILGVPEGRRIVLDCDAGSVDTDPAELAAAERRVATREAQRVAASARAREPSCLADGSTVHVYANLGCEGDALRAVAAGAEGCGLLRTEFLFLDRASEPSEEEQIGAYAAIAAALDGRPLIVRTLDIGGDKPIPYLPFPREENPALGQRGIRHSLDHPELLRTQLRAILRGVPAAQCRIMVPMVIERDELRAVRDWLEAERAAMGVAERIPLGAMIETPAAALLAASLAEEADFFSIGTNDLTQYALACDRGNPATAGRADSLHPAVLRLIQAAIHGARGLGRPVGMCGGLASDPAAVPILIGLGVIELSAAPGIVPEIKAAVRGLRREACVALAERALCCSSAGEVRALLASHGLRLMGAD